MGCSVSSTGHQVELSRSGSVHGGDSSPDKPRQPRPLIFALIRNGHEVVRGGLRDVEMFLQRSELELARAEWEKFRRWFHLHHRLELGTSKNNRGHIGFLSLLDVHFNKISFQEHIYGIYKVMNKAEKGLNAAFETNDLFLIRGLFYKYKDIVLNLLTREDEILMPKVHEMTERNLDIKTIMRDNILGEVVNSFGFESFVRYALQTLERHHGGMPRARVYGYALWAVATEKQWEQWQVWIRESVTKSTFDELQDAIKAELGCHVGNKSLILGKGMGALGFLKMSDIKINPITRQ